MKSLQAAFLRYQPILAPVIILGLVVLTAVGASFFAELPLAAWARWTITALWLAFSFIVVLALGPSDNYDDDEP